MISQSVIVNGVEYRVPVLDITRTSEFKDKYGIILTEDGCAQREMLGVYYTYQLSFAATPNRQEYERLWKALNEAKAFHKVTVPDIDGNYTFEAYFQNIGDRFLMNHKGKNHFKGLTVTFVSRNPQVGGL